MYHIRIVAGSYSCSHLKEVVGGNRRHSKELQKSFLASPTIPANRDVGNTRLSGKQRGKKGRSAKSRVVIALKREF